MSKEQLFKFPLRNVPLEQYCEMSGETTTAIRTRIFRGEWAEGIQYIKKHGRIYIILEGVDQWVESGLTDGQKASTHDVAA